MKKLMMVVLLLLGLENVYALPETMVLGQWINQSGNGLIEITKQQGKYIGTIKGSPDGSVRKDKYNPDPKLQQRQLSGVQIVGDLAYQEENEWEDGWIYDPNNGKTYQCTATLVDTDTLEIRGYVGISLFGRTETWKRYKAPGKAPLNGAQP